MNISQKMQQLQILLKREFWEHKTSTLWVPVVISVIAFLVWLRFSLTDGQMIADLLDNFTLMRPEEARSQMMIGLAGLSLFFVLSLAFIIPVYLTLTLYQDRRDGSYLFWYSMPVSNTLTVLSKLIMATLVMPLISLLIFLILCLTVTAISSLLLLIHGGSLAVIDTVLGAVLQWSLNLLTLIVYLTFWLLPLYGWLLLISAFSRSVPVIWAIGLLLSINLAERLIFSSSYFSSWLSSRRLPYTDIASGFTGYLPAVQWYEMTYGVLIGGILIAGAILMRRFPD